jgi:peptide/nickel transport system substrate-binding protein
VSVTTVGTKEETVESKAKAANLVIIIALVLAACVAQPTTPEPVVETLVVTEVVEATPVETIQVVTPTPEPEGPRTLVICAGFEPETLYPYGEWSPGIRGKVHEAIADGGWNAFDENSFAYQPVILEKVPNLADGDATLAPVSVAEGDRVVDAKGEVVTLDPAAEPPLMLAPAGGGDPVPYQGGEFEMDQLSATFKLLSGLLWSDGAPLTASNSVYAFNLLADPDTPGYEYKFTIARTASYEALDDLTTLWVGLPGYKDSEYFTNFFGPAPEHIWGGYSAAELLTAEVSHLKPVGWGAYIIDEWVDRESITLHKNPNYFRAEEGLPRFDTLIFRFIGLDSTANIAALLSGECDVVDGNGLRDQPELLNDLVAAGQINASFASDGIGWEHLDFGIQHVDYDDGYQLEVDRPDFFGEVQVRQAFAMCLDRQALVDTVIFGQSLVMDTYLSPQHPLYNPDVRHYDFDLQAGSALLEEVGWVDDDGDPHTPRIAQGVTNVPEGTPLVVAYDSRHGKREQIAAFIQESLAECGIQVNIQVYSSGAEYFADGPEGVIFGRNFDLSEFSWGGFFEPPCDLFLSTSVPGPADEDWVSIQDGVERTFGISGWGGSNNPGFVNEDYDGACNMALGSLPGQPEYETAHLEAQRIFAEQLPVVPLFSSAGFGPATRPDMCGLIGGDFWNLEEFDYGEDCEE